MGFTGSGGVTDGARPAAGAGVVFMKGLRYRGRGTTHCSRHICHKGFQARYAERSAAALTCPHRLCAHARRALTLTVRASALLLEPPGMHDMHVERSFLFNCVNALAADAPQRLHARSTGAMTAAWALMHAYILVTRGPPQAPAAASSEGGGSGPEKAASLLQLLRPLVIYPLGWLGSVLLHLVSRVPRYRLVGAGGGTGRAASLDGGAAGAAAVAAWMSGAMGAGGAGAANGVGGVGFTGSHGGLASDSHGALHRLSGMASGSGAGLGLGSEVDLRRHWAMVRKRYGTHGRAAAMARASGAPAAGGMGGGLGGAGASSLGLAAAGGSMAGFTFGNLDDGSVHHGGSLFGSSHMLGSAIFPAGYGSGAGVGHSVGAAAAAAAAGLRSHSFRQLRVPQATAPLMAQHASLLPNSPKAPAPPVPSLQPMPHLLHADGGVLPSAFTLASYSPHQAAGSHLPPAIAKDSTNQSPAQAAGATTTTAAVPAAASTAAAAAILAAAIPSAAPEASAAPSVPPPPATDLASPTRAATTAASVAVAADAVPACISEVPPDGNSAPLPVAGDAASGLSPLPLLSNASGGGALAAAALHSRSNSLSRGASNLTGSPPASPNSRTGPTPTARSPFSRTGTGTSSGLEAMVRAAEGIATVAGMVVSSSSAPQCSAGSGSRPFTALGLTRIADEAAGGAAELASTAAAAAAAAAGSAASIGKGPAPPSGEDAAGSSMTISALVGSSASEKLVQLQSHPQAMLLLVPDPHQQPQPEPDNDTNEQDPQNPGRHFSRGEGTAASLLLRPAMPEAADDNDGARQLASAPSGSMMGDARSLGLLGSMDGELDALRPQGRQDAAVTTGTVAAAAAAAAFGGGKGGELSFGGELESRLAAPEEQADKPGGRDQPANGLQEQLTDVQADNNAVIVSMGAAPEAARPSGVSGVEQAAMDAGGDAAAAPKLSIACKSAVTPAEQEDAAAVDPAEGGVGPGVAATAPVGDEAADAAGDSADARGWPWSWPWRWLSQYLSAWVARMRGSQGVPQPLPPLPAEMVSGWDPAEAQRTLAPFIQVS